MLIFNRRSCTFALGLYVYKFVLHFYLKDLIPGIRDFVI